MTRPRRRAIGGMSAARSAMKPVTSPELFYRYRTPAMHGRWWNTRRQALREAVEAGQAVTTGGKIKLLRGTRIEEQKRKQAPKEAS